MSRLLIVALLIVAVAYAVEDMRCGEDSRGKCFSPFLQLFDILDAYSGNPIPKGTPGKTLLSFSNDLAPSAKFRMCHNGPKVGCDGNDFIDCAALNVTWHPERIPMGDISPTLWTCCYDLTKGTQDKDFSYSFFDSHSMDCHNCCPDRVRVDVGAAAEVSVDDQVQTIEVALYDKIGQFNVSSTW